MIKKGLPSFWDNQEYLISRENSLPLFAHQRNDDSKFDYLEKHLKGQVNVDKLNDDFELLFQFKMIVKSLCPLSYSQYNELEVLTKDMVAHEYPTMTQWTRIIKFGKKLRIFLVKISIFCN